MPKGKQAKKAKASTKAAPKAKAKAKPKSDGPTMASRVVALCQRKNGASPAELNELTHWHAAPWRWMIGNNHKGTGFADRLGLKFNVTKDDGETRYHLSK
jgi:hypothetical protein